MNQLGWSAPERRLDAGTALKGILAQHVQIRDLLVRSQRTAATALAGEPLDPDAVASAIGDIRATMEVHLAFEEKVLLPLLRDDLPLGPVRADRLLDEHRRQRQMLATLHDEAVAGPKLPSLALAGKCHEAALPAAVAGDPDESMSQNPALEERLDLVDHEARKVAARNDRQCSASSL